MNLLKKILGGDNLLKSCPRCLGKGHVDWNDIKRLNQELKWMPGTCAYCNGSGKVDNKIEENVPVDATYLVNNLPKEERKRIVNGHPDALERGKQFEEQIESFINQISYLHFETRSNSSQIAKFFLLGKEGSDSYEGEKQDLVDYVERVILKRLNKNSDNFNGTI